MNDIKAIAFDVFGTVVDWHGSIARGVDRLKLGVDGSTFALAWDCILSAEVVRRMKTAATGPDHARS